MSTSEAYLPEVPVGEAGGPVATVYAEVTATVGVVPLIYRFLATRPGLIERSWEQLAHNLVSPVAATAISVLSREMPGGVDPVPAAVLEGRLDGPLAHATVATYQRANSLNLLAMSALLDGVGGPPATGAAPPAQRTDAAILPMADIAALPDRTAELLRELAAPIAGAAPPVVVPSLLRHFAHDPEVLEPLLGALRPALTGEAFTAEVAVRSRQGRDLAAQLPFGVERLEDEEARIVVERFVTAVIPGMLVTGSLLQSALAGLPR